MLVWMSHIIKCVTYLSVHLKKLYAHSIFFQSILVIRKIAHIFIICIVHLRKTYYVFQTKDWTKSLFRSVSTFNARATINNSNTLSYLVFICVHPILSFKRQHWNYMKCFYLYKHRELIFAPRPLGSVCVTATYHFSYENAHGITPNQSQRLSSVSSRLLCPLCKKREC